MKKDQKYIREVKASFKKLNTETIHVQNPQAVCEFIKSQIGNATKEHFIVLGIDNKNMVIIYHVVSIGTITEMIVHPREVFMPVIKSLCSGVILAHNHPSGNPMPSRQDSETTRRMAEAGKILGIPVIDHIIVGNDYYSFAENGLIER